MPFYMLLLCIAGGMYTAVETKVASLRELEHNWDPVPKNRPENEVLIMYCNG